MRDLTSQDFNDNVNKLRQAFRNDADQSDIYKKAEVRAQEVMQMMLQPMVKNIDKGYKVAVQFQKPQSMDNNLNQQKPNIQIQTKQPTKRLN